MYRAYKFRLYPTDEQKILIHKNFGCYRFIYNHYLTRIKEGRYMNAYACINDCVKNLKSQYSFLRECDSAIIRKSLFNLEAAYKRYFNKVGYFPKYKSRYSRNAYSSTAIYGCYKTSKYCNIELDLSNRRVKIPKLKWVEIRGYRNLKEITGRIINTTISREPNGKYYVSLLYVVSDLMKIKPISIVGLDLGVKKLVTLSDGVEFDNNRYILKYEKRIKRLQRSLARKVKGSKNYIKAKKTLAVLYSKLKNARTCYIHNMTKMITNNYDVIVSENLQIRSMLEEKLRSKNIADAALAEIVRQLKYKAEYKGKYFYQVNTFYPSSQICSVCNNIDKRYKDLSRRKYICRKCFSKMDRDLNASINIMFEGLEIYMNNVLLNK